MVEHIVMTSTDHFLLLPCLETVFQNFKVINHIIPHTSCAYSCIMITQPHDKQAHNIFCTTCWYLTPLFFFLASCEKKTTITAVKNNKHNKILKNITIIPKLTNYNTGKINMKEHLITYIML